MDPGMIALLLAPILLLLLLLAGYAYVDAPNYGMDPTKWALISFFIPFFGFFAYLFERDERKPGPDRDMFVDGVFEIHESRADDTRLVKGGNGEDEEADDDEDEENERTGFESTDTEFDEPDR